jgi:hypothetical protein
MVTTFTPDPKRRLARAQELVDQGRCLNLRQGVMVAEYEESTAFQAASFRATAEALDEAIPRAPWDSPDEVKRVLEGIGRAHHEELKGRTVNHGT